MGESASCCKSEQTSEKESTMDRDEMPGGETIFSDIAEAVIPPQQSSKSNIRVCNEDDVVIPEVVAVTMQQSADFNVSSSLHTPSQQLSEKTGTASVDMSGQLESPRDKEKSKKQMRFLTTDDDEVVVESTAIASRKDAKRITTASAGQFAVRTLARSPTQESMDDDGDTNEDENADDLIDNLVSTALFRVERGSSSEIPANAIDSLPNRDASFGNTRTGEQLTLEKDLVKQLFKANSQMRKQLQPQHVALNRIICSLFVLEKDEPMMTVPSSTPSLNSLSSKAHSYFNGFRHIAASIIENRVYIVFFMFLTFYSIFGPDMGLLWLSKDIDEPSMIINTVVFFLFCIELSLTVIGKNRYWVTVPFVLDVIAVLSILGDTWFMKEGIFGGGDASQVSRMARSSRMTRLTRLVRVVRVTRLLPRLMKICGKQREDLGLRLLEKRLWRSFIFLDHNFTNKIGYFELKCFYLSVITEGKEMLRDNVSGQYLLKADMSILCKADDSESQTIDFYEFKRIFLSTTLGKHLLAFHVQDVEKDEGVWTLTRKLSDNTALKVCVGLLVLIGVLSLLEIDIQDQGPGQGFIQLHEIALAPRNPLIQNSNYMCDQMATYTAKYKVLYVYLDGKVYYESGTCYPAGIPEPVNKAFDRVDQIISQSTLRNNEVIQFCSPHVKECDLSSARSTAIVDDSKTIKDELASSLLTTTIAIVLLLIFVYVLNMGITNFSKTLLQPLRALVDDMMVMSSLELVNIDRDMPTDGTKINMAEELQHLQTACRCMRGAIKSWSKYVPPAVVQKLYASGVEAKIGVAKVCVTILFCDIVGFEDAVRGLSPEDVLDLLGQALGRVADVIARNKGTLLEFIGDEVLAVFNAPNQLKNHTHAGVISALEIHDVISKMPVHTNADGTTIPIRCRCGVNTCYILAGNIGSSQRMKYGLLGDGINLTARLKGINSRYKTQTLASDKVYADDRSNRTVVFRPIDLVAVKGKKDPTTVYEPLALRNASEKSPEEDAAEKHQQAFNLYKAREFASAQKFFEQVRLKFESIGTVDEPSKMLLARCQRYIDAPPALDWDGVERLTKK